MSKKRNWHKYKEILDQYGITKLYHFTDRENLESIIKCGGLYSWADCSDRGIRVQKPGGSELSRKLDTKLNLQHFVRICFTQNHPMMFVAKTDGRISDPVILEIDPSIIYEEDVMFSDMNATKKEAHVGSSYKDFERIHYKTVIEEKHFDLDEDEQPYYQAEVLVRNFVPLKYITNIYDFGIPTPSKSNPLKSVPKVPYSVQITEQYPTAFVFLIDHSASMKRKGIYNGEIMTLADAAAKIVNKTIYELLLHCTKKKELKHYYDIAVIGYGYNAYSAWCGELEGRLFVSPEEIKNNPYKKKITKKTIQTRKGIIERDEDVAEWVAARCDGYESDTSIAIKEAIKILKEWLEGPQSERRFLSPFKRMNNNSNDILKMKCYPPTIINISDNTEIWFPQGTIKELTSLSTDYGNVLYYNICLEPFNGRHTTFPSNCEELKINSFDNAYNLFYRSSLIPAIFDKSLSELHIGSAPEANHIGLAVNSDILPLIKLMNIGTSTNTNSATTCQDVQ